MIELILKIVMYFAAAFVVSGLASWVLSKCLDAMTETDIDTIDIDRMLRAADESAARRSEPVERSLDS